MLAASTCGASRRAAERLAYNSFLRRRQYALERKTTFSGQPSTHVPSETAAGYAVIHTRASGVHDINFISTTRFGWTPSAAQRAVHGGGSHSGGSRGRSPSRRVGLLPFTWFGWRLRIGTERHGRAKLLLSRQCAFERNTTFSGQPSTHVLSESAARFAVVESRVPCVHDIGFNATSRFGWLPSSAQWAVLGG